MTVALHHGAAVQARFWEAVAAGRPVAMVTRLPGDGGPAVTTVLAGDEDGRGGGPGEYGLDP